MSRVDALEKEVQALAPGELAEFRDWFLEFEWQAWDRQIGRDSKAGKLADLAHRIKRDYEQGKTSPL